MTTTLLLTPASQVQSVSRALQKDIAVQKIHNPTQKISRNHVEPHLLGRIDFVTCLGKKKLFSYDRKLRIQTSWSMSGLSTLEFWGRSLHTGQSLILSLLQYLLFLLLLNL